QTQFVSGSSAKTPGEGALSHLGTLVLDETNKYTPKLLETIKDTYDKGYTQSTRSGEVITYPARFLMVGNLNPCACGSLGNPAAICTCTAQKITTHWAKLGRQLIERFDIRLPIRSQGDMMTQIDTPKTGDADYIFSVENALARQRERYKYIEEVDYNGQIHYSTSALLCLKDEINLFNRINTQNNLSSRSQIGLIALARSIADYEDRSTVTEEHFEKARSLRRFGLGDYYWRSLR
ncbi:MAG: ATP-binding protein, partial [Spirochaetales bacterium]|nr:ATP-binding protein [Spirochaetales bacterium]